MNVLIVSAHPEKQSFNTAMVTHSVRVLEDAGHEVKVSDLYEMNWNPVASADDFSNPKNPDYLVYALEQRNGVKDGSIARDIQEELEKLLWCDLLILNFPIFWCSTPAIMKGWIDRVLVSGLCYGGRRVYDGGGLVGKKAMLAVTLGGQPHMFGEGSIHGPLDDMLRHILRGTLAYTGFEVLPSFVGWHVPYISPGDRQDILDQYAERLNNLDSLTPLTFPKLADFDDRFYPLEGRSGEMQ